MWAKPRQFDPYHKWLGIPPKDQPADHYRLLAIERFEADPEVIETAANVRMAYLHGCTTGEHAEIAERLLNEIAAARICLLDARKKADYDLRLRMQNRASSAATPPPVENPPPLAARLAAVPTSPNMPPRTIPIAQEPVAQIPVAQVPRPIAPPPNSQPIPVRPPEQRLRSRRAPPREARSKFSLQMLVYSGAGIVGLTVLLMFLSYVADRSITAWQDESESTRLRRIANYLEQSAIAIYGAQEAGKMGFAPEMTSLWLLIERQYEAIFGKDAMREELSPRERSLDELEEATSDVLRAIWGPGWPELIRAELAEKQQ